MIYSSTIESGVCFLVFVRIAVLNTDRHRGIFVLDRRSNYVAIEVPRVYFSVIKSFIHLVMISLYFLCKEGMTIPAYLIEIRFITMKNFRF